MRRAGSLRACQARSWTTETSNLQNKRAQTAGILRSGLYQSRVSPTTSSTRTENSGQRSTSVQKRRVFQRSLPASKPSSFSGGDKGATWTSKETETTSSSFTCHRSSCPVHSEKEKSASGSTTTSGIHGSVRHANKWENNTNRMHAHVITRTNNKSIGGFFDRPATQPPTRSVEPREIRSYSNNLRSEVAPHRDPIKQWIAEKLTTLEKRDQSFPRRQSAQYRTSTSFQDSVAEYRPSTAAPTIRTPSGVTDQSADRAGKNQATERRFHRSPAATRPEVRKTRLVLSNGTRMVERNFLSGSSRPFTANESSKLLPTPKGTKSPNKLRWMEHLVRGTTSAECWNDSDNNGGASRTRKSVLAVQRRVPEVTRYQNVLQTTLRNTYV
ncbi:uncharacterized protein LOC110117171 isoform X5 [Athalia rosae]|uniref:uncharacterized protein LOC110117171 isoform X5 n=1 Tax=Athalia rosae TaxID=37344 RepID=UPI0020334E9F|nr:uncharacterized protein LOC110117171 isoform X5 [Athalia rosae]XP_048510144.1 uncharacterized protein LOC110117171 isoform X5 [Athalia rosae]